MIHVLSKLFRKKRTSLVTLYDFKTKLRTLIPEDELSPGTVQVRIEGDDTPVYVDAAQLKQGEYLHPPFAQDIREILKALARDLADVRPLSYSDWEDGFRRDHNPEREIASWIHLAAVLETVTSEFKLSSFQRKACFTVLIACSTGPKETVRQRSEDKTLESVVTETAIRYFYEGGYTKQA
jgi:hypothetical protein